MKIKLIGTIRPPLDQLRSDGPRVPAVLKGEIILELTPKMFEEMLLYGEINLPGLCEFFIETDSEAKFQKITLEENIPTITTNSGYLLSGSKKKTADRIKKLIEQG